jgi:transcriptional regulator with XRE-family HTH domain
MPRIKATKTRLEASAARAASSSPPPASIAARIRSIRRRKGITLERLSNDCGLDRGYLSRIERGHKTPSIATLLKIGEALGVQMAHLFGETVEQSAITVVRHTQYKPFSGPRNAKDAVMMVLPQSEARRASLVVVSPGAETTLGPAEHSGEEIIFVLAGQVGVSFADHEVTLSEGDCVHFDGHLKHTIRKVGDGHARAAVIVIQDLPPGARSV